MSTFDLDDLPSPLLLVRDALVVAVNDRAAAELARSAPDILGAAFAASLADESRAELEAALARAAEAPPIDLNGRRPGVSAPASDDPTRFILVRRPESDGLVSSFELGLRAATDGSVLIDIRDLTELVRVDAAVGALSTSTFGVDRAGELVWRPIGNARRLGVSDEEAIGATALEWLHPEDLPGLLAIFTELLGLPGATRSGDFRARQPYLPDHWVQTRITGVNALDDPDLGFILVSSQEHDVPDLIESLRATTGQFQSLAEAAPVGIVVTDREGRALYHNRLARELLALDDDVGRTNWTRRAHPDHHNALDRIVDAALAGAESDSTVAAFDLPGDRRVWLRVDALPQRNTDGELIGLIATLQDVTEETVARQALHAAQERLWHLANHDSLTQLPNRSHLLARLDEALRRNDRADQGVALLYVDLDGFKSVNDNHGHVVGDQVLLETAHRLRAAVRETDLVARFGGDEFVVLCERFDHLAQIGAVADRIVAEIAVPVVRAGNVVRIGATVGVAAAHAGTTADQLVGLADQAMYRGKAAGKGRVQIA